MKRQSWAIEAIKLIIAIGIGWVAFIFILAILMPKKAEFSDSYGILTLLLSLCFVFVIGLVTSYNNISRLKNLAEACYNNIGISRTKIERLEKHAADAKTGLNINENFDWQKYLEEIAYSEKEYADAKLKYNNAVEAFNSAIHCFPANLLRVLMKNSDLNFYSEPGSGSRVLF